MTSRLRLKGQFVPGPTRTAENIYTSCAHLAWVNNGTYTGHLMGEVRSMVDEVVSNFNARRAAGEIFMNRMSQVIQTSHSEGNGCWYEQVAGTPQCAGTGRYVQNRENGDWFPLYLNYYNPSPTAPYNQRLGVSSLLSSSDIDAAAKECVTKCWANRTVSDSNLFESVAEYRSTMRTIGDLFLRTAATLKRWLRNPLVGASSAHLMYRYAISPLIRDVQGIVKGLDKPLGNVRKTTRSSVYLHRSSSSNGTFNNGGYSVKYLVQNNDEVRVRAMSIDEYRATLMANIGFTDVGLLTTPWELVPWSFVLDWFVNVGDFLRAVSPSADRKQLGSCFVISRLSSTVRTISSTTPGTNFSLVVPMTGSVIDTLMRKDRYPALAPPGLTIKSDFRFDDLTRVADAVALVTQLVSRVAAKHPLGRVGRITARR